MNTNNVDLTTRQHEADALFQKFIQAFIDKDTDAWMDLWDEDGVQEFPFAPEGRVRRVEGKQALRTYIQAVISDAEITRVLTHTVYVTQEPELIIVEVTVEGRIPSSGHTFPASYVWFVRTKDGKISHVKDYWNPLTMMAARGQGSSDGK
jgi:ketosteroid isomerase-like protein